jgi:membrane protease subunit (stomatin/prohibitin family)
VFVVGLICTIGGMISFFSSFGSFEPPRYFWLCFIGLPLMFAGGVLSQFGFMGAVTRYIAGESAPVATDTINYVADETKSAVETVAKSAAKGIAEGIEAGRAVATNFCPHCGTTVKADFKFCPKCGKALASV